MNGQMETPPSNVDMVVAALYFCGGATTKVHTEDIALEAFRLAPAQFSWRKYPKYPDKDIVRVALTDAAKDEKGRLVKGRSGRSATGKEEDGWQLTPAGAKWAAAKAEVIRDALGAGSGRSAHRDVDRMCQDVRRSDLFRRWQEGSLRTATHYDFTDFLGCSPDALPATIIRRFERVSTAAHAARNEEVIGFLEACRTRFASLFAH